MTDDISKEYREQDEARARVQAPGILLIVIGVLNFGLALWFLLSTVILLRSGDEAIRKVAKEQWSNMSGDQRQQLINAGYTEERYVSLFLGVIDAVSVWSGVTALVSLLVLVGGVQMIRLRTRGLAMTGAIVAAIPGLSCLSCLLLGEAIGIWCLVVLCSTDVVAGFASAARSRFLRDEPPPQ